LALTLWEPFIDPGPSWIIPDAFAPLTEAELADAARQLDATQETQAAKLICPPADTDEGETAAEGLFGRKPDAAWRYETGEGEAAFLALRWNEGGGEKTFRPLSWRDGEGWQFAAWPKNRPLYILVLSGAGVLQRPVTVTLRNPCCVLLPLACYDFPPA
jgi:hypothetical protein